MLQLCTLQKQIHLNPFPPLMPPVAVGDACDRVRFPDGPVDLRRWVPRHRRPGTDRYERFPAHDTGRSTLDAHTTAWSALRRPLLVDVYEGEVTATQTVRVRGRSVRRYCLSI